MIPNADFITTLLNIREDDLENFLFQLKMITLSTTSHFLAKAYELKEYYRRFNKEATYEEAVEKYDDVVKLFKNSGIPQYYEFISILVTLELTNVPGEKEVRTTKSDSKKGHFPHDFHAKYVLFDS